MDNYKKQCPIDGGTCGQGGTCFVCENESLGAKLAAAKARIAELEKALEPFAREAAEWNELCKDSDIPKICGPADPYDLYDAAFDVGDLRRAAALLKEDNQ